MKTRRLILACLSSVGMLLSARAEAQFVPSVPIKVPDGRRGMQPNLALVYDVNAGNGLVGVGWTLTGLSEITRVNYGSGINFDANDTFAHSDAGTLMLQPEPQTVDPSGSGYRATYRSKKESFMRFQSFGACEGGDPCYWIVRDKSGNRYYYGQYGNDPGSRLVTNDGNNPHVKAWALAAVQDLYGNAYTVAYTPDPPNGRILPYSITYNQNGTNYYFVRFYYQGRQDFITHTYSSHHYLDQVVNLLQYVEISSWTYSSGGCGGGSWNQTFIRRYALNYQVGHTFDGATGRNRLISVQEQGYSAGTWYGLPPQTFEWQDSTQSFIAGANGGNAAGWQSPDYQQILTGDFDGDGHTDQAHVYVASGHVHIDVHLWSYGSNSQGQPWFVSASPWVGSLTANGIQWFTGDWDGDGYTDIITVYPHADGSVVIDVFRSTGGSGNPGGQSFVERTTYSDVQWIGLSTGNSKPYGTFLVGDFNGDGKTDVIYPHAYSTLDCQDNSCYQCRSRIVQVVTTWYSNGTGFDKDESQLPPLYGCLPTWDVNWQQHGTFLAGDFNGDGRTTVGFAGRVDSNGNSYISFYPVSTNTIGSTVNVSNYQEPWQCDTNWTQCATFMTGDFNGDGKTDVAYLFNKNGFLGVDVFIAGLGWSQWSQDGAWTTGGNGTDWQRHGTFLVGDFNGDGLADIAHAVNTAGTTDIYVYQSDGFVNFHLNQSWASGQVPWYGGDDWQSVAAFFVGGFYGSGSMDIGYAYKNAANTASYDLYSSQSLSAPDLMTVMHNGLGGTTSIGYIAAPVWTGTIDPTGGVPNHIANTSPQQLVASVTVSDGRNGTYTTNYQYFEPRLRTGAIPDQRNLGFRRVKVIDGQTLQSVETIYDQQDGYEGLPLEVWVRDGNGQEMHHTNYLVYSPVLQPATNTEFVELLFRTDEVYEQGINNQAYSLSTSYTYDAYGNVTTQQVASTGLDAFSVPYVTSTYDTSDASNWIRNRLTEQKTYDGQSTLKSDVKYNWGTNCNSSFPNFLTSVQRWLDTSSTWITTSFCYFDNGLLKSVTEPATDDQITRTTNYTYDSAYQVHVASIIDSADNVASFTYTENGDLQQFFSPAANGSFSYSPYAYFYDMFWRLTREGATTGEATDYAYLNLGTVNDPSPTNNQHIQTTTWVDQSRTIVSNGYFDGSGFSYRRERSGDNGQTICTFAQKDSAGRLKKVSNPTYNCDHLGDAWTVANYDAAGRLHSIQTPDTPVNQLTFYDYGIDHGGPTPLRYVKVTDPNNHQTKQYFNALENMVKVVDPRLAATTYDYDALGRVTLVTLPNGGWTSFQYDTLGRKTRELQDADVDPTSYVYYDNGNLKTITRGAGSSDARTVLYRYDAANRVTSKEPDGNEPFVTYAYDDPNYLWTKGRLTTVNDASGTTHYTYTLLGQIAAVQKIIDGNSYTVAYQYDYGGRVTQMTYPDGSVAQYQYTDGGGNLASVALNSGTYATWPGYDAFGSPTSKTYPKMAVPITTTYSRDDMHHLTRIDTTHGSSVLQKLRFDWYAPIPSGTTNGLALAGIADERTSKIINGVNTDETASFDYDNLYRVTFAAGVWPGTRSYAYDGGSTNGVGNPTTFGAYTQRSLTFNNNPPTSQQVVSGTDGANWNMSGLTYDRRGNMRFKTVSDLVNGGNISWRYDWTAENLLASAQKYQTATWAQMTYDYRGQRVKKLYHPDNATTGITTTYIDNLYEKRVYDDASERHTLNLYGNGDLLMSWTRSGQIQTSWNEQNGWRTEVAAASMYNVRSLKGFGKKVYHLARAGLKHPMARPYALFALLSLVLAIGFSALLKRTTRYPRRTRFVAASVLLAFGASACSQLGPRLGESGRNILSNDTINGPGLGFLYYHRSHVGSSAVVTDDNGNEVSRMVYMPFGELAAPYSVGTDVVTRKFTGQEADEELGQKELGGLYYYNARYYDPQIGRFLSADPIVPSPLDAQSWNRYSYTRNNPITRTDPSGNCDESSGKPCISGSTTIPLPTDPAGAGGRGRQPCSGGALDSNPACHPVSKGTGANRQPNSALPVPTQQSDVEGVKHVKASQQVHSPFTMNRRIPRPGDIREPRLLSAQQILHLGIANGQFLSYRESVLMPNGFVDWGGMKNYAAAWEPVFGLEWSFASGVGGLSRGSGVLKVDFADVVEAGAGGNWQVIGEVQGGRAIGQATPVSCGAACGEMLTGVDQGLIINQAGAPTSAAQLAKALGPGFQGGYVGPSQFGQLMGLGRSWAAHLYDGGSMGHMVVVDGFDSTGNYLLIRDPFGGGSSYMMTQQEFFRVWNGEAVF